MFQKTLVTYLELIMVLMYGPHHLPVPGYILYFEDHKLRIAMIINTARIMHRT